MNRGDAGDAVVVGAGHNGLVAANLLIDAGWNVVVLEASGRPGGAIKSDGSLYPGFVTDWYSAFYPLAAASPGLCCVDRQGPALQPGRARGRGYRQRARSVNATRTRSWTGRSAVIS
jgi:phytoene dehydrogenase-like protein